MNKREMENYHRLATTLEKHGVTAGELATLLRCERTLQRWAELECGDGNEYGSWAIERDEITGKPEMVHHHYLHGRGKDYTTRKPIADRERGALQRAQYIAANHGLTVYHQTDPRGCALYIIRPGDVRGGASVESCYTNGVAVCV